MPQNVTSELAEKSFEGHMKRVFDIIILKDCPLHPVHYIILLQFSVLQLQYWMGRRLEDNI